MQQLRAQISAYRYAARNLPVPVDVNSIAVKLNQPPPVSPGKPKSNYLPEPYAVPGFKLGFLCSQLSHYKTQFWNITSGGQVGDLDQLPYSLPAVLQIFQQRNRITPVTKPTGIDPMELMRERENRIMNRLGLRIKELDSAMVTVDPKLRTQLEINMRSLRLLNYQKQVFLSERFIIYCEPNWFFSFVAMSTRRWNLKPHLKPRWIRVLIAEPRNSRCARLGWQKSWRSSKNWKLIGNGVNDTRFKQCFSTKCVSV